MSVTVTSFSLPSDTPTITSTEQRQTQQRLITASSRPRSTGDVSRFPPQYSAQMGSLPTTSVALAATLSEAPADAAPPRFLRPPRYSSVFSRTRDHTRRTQHEHTASDSFAGSGSSGPQAHEFHIKSGGRNWATLKVISRTSVGLSSFSSSSSTSSSGQRVPRFTGNDLVQGCLELNLETPQNINSISLAVRSLLFKLCSLWDLNLHTLAPWSCNHKFVRRWFVHLS